MDVVAYVGTLLGLFAFLMSRPEAIATPNQSVPTTGHAPPNLSLADDKPNPILSVTSSVQGTSNLDIYTLVLYVKSGTNIESVEILFKLSDYADANEIVSTINQTLSAWPHSSVAFPSWSSISASQSSGYLTLSGGPYTIAFGHTSDSEDLLYRLGFDDIPVTKLGSLITDSVLLAERPTKFSLYKWNPTFDVNIGDTISLSAAEVITLRIRGSVSYFVTVFDGTLRHIFGPRYVTGKHIQIRALQTGRLTLSHVFPKESTSGSPATFLTFDEVYLSPASVLLPGSPISIYIEAVGAGGSSTTAFYGGAGACISGYVKTLTNGPFTITPGLHPSDSTTVTATNLSVIAGGGGGGGTYAVGGSAHLHGNDGFFSTVPSRLGKYSILQNHGKGATNVGVGLSPKGAPGVGGTGGSLTGYPKGGSGQFGGGSGGRELVNGHPYYGGGGAGSSRASGLSFVRATHPQSITETPKTTKPTLSGSYGNGGNQRVSFGQGAVRIRASYE